MTDALKRIEEKHWRAQEPDECYECGTVAVSNAEHSRLHGCRDHPEAPRKDGRGCLECERERARRRYRKKREQIRARRRELYAEKGEAMRTYQRERSRDYYARKRREVQA